MTAALLFVVASGNDAGTDKQCEYRNSYLFLEVSLPAERECCVEYGEGVAQIDVGVGRPMYASMADASGQGLDRSTERRTDKDKSGFEGAPPPMYAVGRRSDAKRAKMALAADPNVTDDGGRAARAGGVESGLGDQVTAPLEAGPTADGPMDDGKTLLYLAVASGNTEAVLRLLADGAHADGDRHNPLEAAVRAKAADLASALLNAGANPNGGYDVPLVAAAWNGDVALLELLLERGANVNKADWKDRTPLHAAVHGHRDAAVGWLLANGAVPQSSGNAMTALHWLMYTEPPSLSVLQSLLAAGADPQADDRRGSQPLHYVAGTDCLTIVQTLLRAGADALAGNKLGSTPLHMAALGGSLDVLEVVLAAAGPDVNPVDMRGRTPLHYAAVADRDLPIVEALLGAGAALDARDGRNRTAHALAEYWSTKPVVVQRLAGGQ